jgi:hypothetical protein
MGVLLRVGIAANLETFSVEQLHGCVSGFGVHEHDEPDEPAVSLSFM